MVLKIGRMEHGARNNIADVPGVTVGHCTVDNERHKTGVTVVMPCQDDIFKNNNKATIDLSELSESGVIIDNQLNLDW